MSEKRRPMPSPEEQIMAIIRSAYALGAVLQGDLSPEWRAEIEGRIRGAYESLAPQWSVDFLRASLTEMFNVAARAVEHGTLSEGQAVEEVAAQVERWAAGPLAPEESRGKRPTTAKVATCLRLWTRKAGHPTRGHEGKKWDALADVCGDLGIRISGKSIQRDQQRKKRRR